VEAIIFRCQEAEILSSIRAASAPKVAIVRERSHGLRLGARRKARRPSCAQVVVAKSSALNLPGRAVDGACRPLAADFQKMNHFS